MALYSSAATRMVYPGDLVTLFDAQTVAAGDSSIAVAVPPNLQGATPQFSVWLSWASSPTDVVTVQASNQDVDADYTDTTTKSTNTQVDTLQFSANSEFIRINVGTYSAGGALTAKLYRAA